MQDGDKVLSQNEIDAMLAGTSAPTPAVAEPPPAVAPPPVQQIVQSIPASAPPEVASPVVPSGGDTAQLQQQVQALTAQLQALTEKVDGIISGLQATVGFNAQGTFTCNSCKSLGLVAARLTCTSCGTEDWWGWFPPAQ